MFQVLVESRAPRARRGSFTAVSIGVHPSLIAAAALLTARMEIPLRTERVAQIVYSAPAPASARAAAAASSASSALIAAPTFTVPQVATPTFAFPSTDIFARVLQELSETSIGSPVGARTSGSFTGQIHTAQTVDRIVAPLAGNPCRRAMRSSAKRCGAGSPRTAIRLPSPVVVPCDSWWSSASASR